MGFDFVAGCDEVGVGPLAGPVVAAACVIDPACISGYRSKKKWYYRVRDSKTVNEKERGELVEEILDHCLLFGIGVVDHTEIDRLNIHNAALLAMQKAIQAMLAKAKTNPVPQKLILYIDGRFVIKNLSMSKWDIKQQAIIDGDASILSISAASIIAKVHRDGLMNKLAKEYPMYGFSEHKGYNTKGHREAIVRHGATPYHRKSFLKNILNIKDYTGQFSN